MRSSALPRPGSSHSRITGTARSSTASATSCGPASPRPPGRRRSGRSSFRPTARSRHDSCQRRSPRMDIPFSDESAVASEEGTDDAPRVTPETIAETAAPARRSILRDRNFRRLWTGVTLDLLAAAAVASVPIAYAFGSLSLGQLFALAVFFGVLDTFWEPAWNSFLPRVVASSRLVEANSKAMLSVSATGVVGPGLAGVLVDVFS